jgi:hypothetical protein
MKGRICAGIAMSGRSYKVKQSESITKLAAALVKAQGQIHGARASGINPHFKAEYSTLADIWTACRPALAANGLAVVQTPGKTRQNEDGRNYLSLDTQLVHESGEWIEQSLTMPLAKIDPQGYGSALTYARRYALASMVGVVTVDDDAENATNHNAPGTTAVPVTKSQNGKPDAPPSDAQKKGFHAAGVTAYGDEWDDRRPILVAAVTNDRTKSSNELTAPEMAKLQTGIAGVIERNAAKKAERAQNLNKELFGD